MKSKSSKIWLKEHFSDLYVKRAKHEGHRARSVYKLEEINKKYQLIKQGMTIVDLGAAPGSWSEFAAKIVGKSGKIVAIDILPLSPIKYVTFIQGDFTTSEIVKLLLNSLGDDKVDLIFSDMAPNTTGIPEVDHLRSMNLAESAFDFAKSNLKQNGSFLVKVFQGKNLDNLVKSLKLFFTTVSIIKPKSSRQRSREVFLLGLKFIN